MGKRPEEFRGELIKKGQPVTVFFTPKEWGGGESEPVEDDDWEVFEDEGQTVLLRRITGEGKTRTTQFEKVPKEKLEFKEGKFVVRIKERAKEL